MGEWTQRSPKVFVSNYVDWYPRKRLLDKKKLNNISSPGLGELSNYDLIVRKREGVFICVFNDSISYR